MARLILDGHAAEDREPLALMWADTGIVAGSGGPISSRKDSRMRLLGCRGLWPLPGFGYWALGANSDGTFMGDIGLADCHREVTPSIRQLPKAGGVVARRWHGQGLAGEVPGATEDRLDRQNAHPASVCLIDPGHTASLRLAASAGFGRACALPYEDGETLLLTRERNRGT